MPDTTHSERPRPARPPCTSRPAGTSLVVDLDDARLPRILHWGEPTRRARTPRSWPHSRSAAQPAIGDSAVTYPQPVPGARAARRGLARPPGPRRRRRRPPLGADVPHRRPRARRGPPRGRCCACTHVDPEYGLAARPRDAGARRRAGSCASGPASATSRGDAVRGRRPRARAARAARRPTRCSTSPVAGRSRQVPQRRRSTWASGCAPRAAASRGSSTPCCSSPAQRGFGFRSRPRCGRRTSRGAATRCSPPSACPRARASSRRARCCSPPRSCSEQGEAVHDAVAVRLVGRRARRRSPRGSTGTCGRGRSTPDARARWCSTPGRRSTSTTTSTR